MASAVLANSNEQFPLHRHYAVKNNLSRYAPISNPNPNPNPNPSPNFQLRPNSNPNPNPSPRPATWHPNRAPAAGDVTFRDDYVTISLSDYSKTELRELERRLRAELAQVRQAQAQIEKIGPKKLSGRKRGAILGPTRGPKREKVEERGYLDGIVKKVLIRCSQMLGKLMKHKHAWVFNSPVDTVGLGLHDYFQIIKRPMDLGTVKAKLSRKEYKDPSEFAYDVRLTFKNAMVYNPKGQDAHIMADNLMGVFDKMFNPSFVKFEAEKGRLLAALGRNKIVTDGKICESNRVEGNVAKSLPIQKFTNSEKKGLDKKVMSYEEKTKLGISLQEVSMENMGEMLAILSKKNKGMAQDGDEIELDFDTLDNETLWELNRFVSNLKKVDDLAVPLQVEKCDIVEEDVDIGEDIPITNYPPVEIEKDSSSGSSSGSSSSSGSGGSVTSSGSDSDEDSVQSPFVEPK